MLNDDFRQSGRSLLLVFLFIALSPFCNQIALGEEDDEVIQEIRERLSFAKSAREVVRQQSELADKRVELLEKGVDVRREMIKLERTLERIEESDDEDEEVIDELREAIERKEFWLEVAEGELELYTQFGETLNLSREIHADQQDEFVKPVKHVIELQRKRLKEHRRLAKAIEAGDDEGIEELEMGLEELGRQAEIHFEIVELRRALVWAEQENEEAEIEELEKRLKRLREELDEEERDHTSDKANANSANPGALPVSITNEEIVAAGRESFEHRMSGLLRDSCFECHDSNSAMGDLDLESIVQVSPLVTRRSDWKNVIAQLKSRSMPPVEAEQPTEEDRKYMAAWLTDKIDNFDYTTVRQVGYEPAKRLTHDEYNHTIRDLFGVNLRPADKFPDDMVASSGFDNSANSLFIQPITMERYVGAADEVVSQVFAQEASRSRFFSWTGLSQRIRIV